MELVQNRFLTWERACASVAGGNGLLSKRPDRYLPGEWPTFYTRAKGIEVWDQHGRRYLDFAQMSVGAAILGYSHDELNDEVIEAIKSGVSTTLNCCQEVLLAEALLRENPFASKVRFARTGAEAMAMAVRLARVKSGRDGVAISGYHGWADWYLAANLGTDALGEHLLPGLEPAGVPRTLQGTTLAFKYNSAEALEELMQRDTSIGVLCIEGARYEFPTPSFLEAIKHYVQVRGLVVIVDEITSGFRTNCSGVYVTYPFTPDIVVFGKALGGGFAISAVLGNDDIMSGVGRTFMSSTMWTERVGFVAGLKTLEIIKREKLWIHLSEIGEEIGGVWKSAASHWGLKIKVTEVTPLISFKFELEKADALMTLYTREMLLRGYLAASSVYVSLGHTKDAVLNFRNAVYEVFEIVAACLRRGVTPGTLPHGARTDAFVRLT